MLAIISPAKTLDFNTALPPLKVTQPQFLDQSAQLIKQLRTLSEADLQALMRISANLAELNQQRYQSWSRPFSEDNARPALLAFKGDVYTGFTLDEYTSRDYTFAQKHLRILSGLYGLLRPLDLIQAYRLEMGTSLKNSQGDDLYSFWQKQVTTTLISAIKDTQEKTLINLASKEYFKAIDTDAIEAAGIRIITPQFKDWKNGTYKFITFYGKKARGMMVNYIIQHSLKQADQLKNFDAAGYSFNQELSQADDWVFTRKQN
ncbi:MAG: peroxide stress protein YaaA [Verrucomicrobiales bacterium]|nr:peroxide stress protein YaaA [Verrucomicrobiales bacterium]